MRLAFSYSRLSSNLRLTPQTDCINVIIPSFIE